MLDEVQTYAANDGDFVLGHGSEKLFHGHFLVCDFCGWVEDVVVFDIDDLGFETSFFGRCAYVKVRRG